jgi:hypothetical protein
MVLTLKYWRRPTLKFHWLMAAPAVWLLWQFISSAATVNATLTNTTLAHFTACALCFYLGLFQPLPTAIRKPMFLGILIAFVLILVQGLDQHFGGLEEMRDFVKKHWNELSAEARRQISTPEFQKKISSERIFATYVYPNALAGGILLFLPICVAAVCHLFNWLQWPSRLFLLTILSAAALACLYWSGSKAGWLIFLALGAFAFFHIKLTSRLRLIGVLVLVCLGTTAFYARYAGYFAKGATSAVARADYWKCAVQVTVQKPVFGSGPGTFMVEYKNRKSPEAEMARLAHNDYLEQASDSGLPGFFTYAIAIIGSLGFLYRYRSRECPWLYLALWLGVAGLAVQSVVEFGLYIPGLAWPFFFLLGYLWNDCSNRIDNPKPAS